MKENNHFSKKHKILKNSEFRFKGDFFDAKVCKFVYRLNSFKNSRLGLVVTKRFSKSAVVRNKMKRVIREKFRASNNLKNSHIFPFVHRLFLETAFPSPLEIFLNRLLQLLNLNQTFFLIHSILFQFLLNFLFLRLVCFHLILNQIQFFSLSLNRIK